METVDPRSRIVIAVLLSAVLAVSQGWATLGVALLTAVLATSLTRLRLLASLRRLVPVNVFALVILLLLPWTIGHSAGWAFGSFQYSHERFLMAVTIALKANAILLWTVVLLGGMDIVTLGHALWHLGVPEKLAHLLLFSVRYVDVFHGEYRRLRTAMKMRGFRPRLNVHTYRTFGYLVGMLLVRSLDRSERILAAMKCRGFRGRFYLLDHFAFSRRDVWFASASFMLLTVLALVECS